MLNGLGGEMTPVDFVFTMSKVKVTRVTFVKQCKNGVLIETYLSQSYHILCDDWISLEHDNY